MKVPLPFKVILLGNYGVGKTLFLERASELSDLEGRSSILTDLINESAGSFRIRVRLDNDNNGQLKLNHNQEAKVEGLIRTQSPKDATSIETVLLDLFDPSGMEQYDSIPRSFYRHADAVLLFFDVTDRQSWLDVGKWHQKALENSRKVPLTFMLVGTKSDETRKRQVTLYEARRLADSFNVSLMETSAKFGTNIPACMSNLSASLVAKHRSYIKVPRSIKVDETKQHMPMYLTNVNEESASSCWGSAFALDSATYGNDFSTTSNQLILDLLLAKAGEKAVLAHQLHHRDSSGAGKLCPWGCGSIIKNFSSNSAKHFESECTNRFITCKLGCGLRTRKQEISDHMQRLCSNRVELCLVKGCDEIVKASLLSFHQGEYKKKPISLWKRYDIIHWVNDIVRCEARLRNGIDGRLLMNQLVIEGQNNIAALKRILNVHLGDFESENDVYARLLKSLQRIRETEEHYANKRDVAIIKRSDEYMEVNNVNTIVQERDHEDSAQQEKQSNINKLDSTENKRTDGQFRRKSENNSLMESIRGFQVHELSRISGNEISSSGMPSQQAPFSLSLTAGIATFDRSALRRASSSSATDYRLREGLQAGITGFDRSSLRKASASTSSSKAKIEGSIGASLTGSIASFDRGTLRKTDTNKNEANSLNQNTAAHLAPHNNGNNKLPVFRQSLANVISGFDRSTLKKVSTDEGEEAARKKRRSFSKPIWATEFEKALDKRREMIHDSSSDSDGFDEE